MSGRVTADPAMPDTGRPLFAAVEAGGTKFNVAVGHDPRAPLVAERVGTGTPDETLGAVATILAAARARHGPIAGLGIAAFGPIDLRRESPGWGHLLRTPKPGWSGVDLVGPLADAAGCPAAIDTDVNGAALAEWRWGAGCGVASLAYVTIGTGIGGGLLFEGRPRHGLVHPEIGHIPLRRHCADGFAGICPYHGDCAEGLLSGPALAARFGMPLDRTPADHPFRAVFVDYVGQLCATLVLVTSIERIVIGGGVLTALPIHGAIQARMAAWLGGYVASNAVERPGFVVAPGLGDRSGVAGAFALAARAVDGCGAD